MEAHVLEAVILCGRSQFFLPGRSQAFVGPACPDHFAPEVNERPARAARIGRQPNGDILAGVRSGRRNLPGSDGSKQDKEAKGPCDLRPPAAAADSRTFHSPCPFNPCPLTSGQCERSAVTLRTASEVEHEGSLIQRDRRVRVSAEVPDASVISGNDSTPPQSSLGNVRDRPNGDLSDCKG